MTARLRGLADPLMVDAAVALALGLIAEIGVFVGTGWRGPTALNAVCVAAVAASLWWRRRRPLAVLVLTTVIFSGLALAFGSSDPPTGFFLLIVVGYSAGSYAPNPWAAAALLALLAAVHDLREYQVTTFGDALYLFVVLGLVFLFGLGMRARQAQTAQVERERDTVAELAVEDERRRIARELHDIISHSLGVLVLQAGAAEQVLERDPQRAREVLRSIRTMGQEAITEMGTLLSLVRSEAESSLQPQPSLADLDQLLSRTRQAGLGVELETHGEPCELPAPLALSAYRIVQEGLTNALKHADNATARVIVRYGPSQLEVEVIDDGTESANGSGSRRGLAGIGERVAVFGGRFEAGPRAEGGWRLRAALPLSR
jgi:signal transduction histidine kinase